MPWFLVRGKVERKRDSAAVQALPSGGLPIGAQSLLCRSRRVAEDANNCVQGQPLWRGNLPHRPCDDFGTSAETPGTNAKVGVGTGAMTPWLVHDMRGIGDVGVWAPAV